MLSALPVVAILAAVLGAIGGVAADRLAARWPAHPAPTDGPAPPTRGLDWRTAMVAGVSAAAFGALATRYAEPRDLVVLGVYFAALVVLLATDLDQKLLPDVITFPLAGFCLAVLLLGWGPILADKPLGLVSGLAAGIGTPILLAVSDRIFGGALGMGDLKLAVSLGLMSGITALIVGFLIAFAASSVVLLVLIAARRLSLRSAIPFGPILIVGGMIAALTPT